MKKNIAVFIFAVSSMLILSCSAKDVTLRRIEDVHKAEQKLAKNPDDEETVLEVLNAAQNGGREVRAEAIWVLGKIEADIAYSDFLRASVEDPDFNVRCLAVLGLGRLDANNPEAIDRIKRAISDTDLQVQIEGLKVAGRMNAKELLNSILDSLSSKNKWVRMAAVEALKDYDDARVDRSLNLLVSTDKDYAVRSTINQVIEYRKNKKTEVKEEIEETASAK
ncbi:HEAT repeat domain-containing protein [Brachyspira hampsonii]|nr:HEAT repeat domain-containing protein [Brachyspira hampsonii]MBW5389740.1 HEAT repeat domain-containing protein [Brachyspira hampsonii]MBW5395247.1 HEAT repeat domain-containing protein [Brachyspira hampsonii]OEJ15121.1 PBS lyase [Brachyspira hampsonii]PTY41330.1 PBS lyase [Brachyspira hampsonii bv. II]